MVSTIQGGAGFLPSTVCPNCWNYCPMMLRRRNAIALAFGNPKTPHRGEACQEAVEGKSLLAHIDSKIWIIWKNMINICIYIINIYIYIYIYIYYMGILLRHGAIRQKRRMGMSWYDPFHYEIAG